MSIIMAGEVMSITLQHHSASVNIAFYDTQINILLHQLINVSISYFSLLYLIS